MKNINKPLLMLLLTAVMVWGFALACFADVTISTSSHEPYFHSGHGPIGNVFYFIGDVIVLPFRFVGNLFS